MQIFQESSSSGILQFWSKFWRFNFWAQKRKRLKYHFTRTGLPLVSIFFFKALGVKFINFQFKRFVFHPRTIIKRFFFLSFLVLKPLKVILAITSLKPYWALPISSLSNLKFHGSFTNNSHQVICQKSCKENSTLFLLLGGWGGEKVVWKVSRLITCTSLIPSMLVGKQGTLWFWFFPYRFIFLFRKQFILLLENLTRTLSFYFWIKGLLYFCI